jgi:hypothetical protein
MKRSAVFALVIVVALGFSSVSARPVYGVKGGIMGSNMYGADTGGLDTRVAGCFGGFVEYFFTETAGIQGEILYMMKGWSVGGGGTDVSYDLNYVQIPVMLKLRSGPPERTTYHVMVGPAIGVTVKDEIGCEGFGCTSSGVKLVNDVFTANSTDFGLVVGVGVAAPVANYNLNVEVRGDLGLFNVYEEVDFDSFENVQLEAKNASFGLLVGMGF